MYCNIKISQKQHFELNEHNYMELKCTTLINTKKHENYQHCIKATNLLPLTAPLTPRSLFFIHWIEPCFALTML